jgi:hypothetical protein
LKGLHNSPKIISDPDLFNAPGIISAKDISCVVIPDQCLGLPTLACIEQNIPVIAVKENKNTMNNDLERLPFKDKQLIVVNNYLEAAGAVSALKAGVTLESITRPLKDSLVF